MRLLCFLVLSLGSLFFSAEARADSRALLTEVMQEVHDSFLGQTEYDSFSIAALQGLTQIDPNLIVADDKSRVTIYYNSKVFRSIQKPSGQKQYDVNAWVRLVLKSVDAAKAASPVIKSKDFELMDVMLKKAVSSLDGNSKYLSALFPDDEKLRFSRDFAARMLDGDVLYIKIKAFTKITPQNVKNALMQNQFLLKAIIIDLRDCKGGALASAIDTAKLFMNYGVIAVTKGKNQSDKAVFMSDESGVIAGVPMVILVDAATASSAEVFASAMQENALATVWGTQTYGKGTVQNIVSLPDDNKMLLTNAYVYSPSGKEINGVGILPDVCLYRAKDSAKLDDVMQEFSVCPKEVRGDRRIDIDLAKSFLLTNLNAK